MEIEIKLGEGELEEGVLRKMGTEENANYKRAMEEEKVQREMT